MTRAATRITLNGQVFDLDAVVNLMDDDLREALHFEEFETEQAFLDAYAAAHLAKFGRPFEVI